MIIKSTPKEKRLAYVDNLNKDEEMWKKNDELEDYTKEIHKSFAETVKDCAAKGADIGEEIGSIFGSVGEKVGRSVGKVVGSVVGVGKAVLGRLFG